MRRRLFEWVIQSTTQFHKNHFCVEILTETRYDNVILIPIRNPRWEQKRTEDYVIVSNQRHNSVVHIAFSVVIGGGVRLETHIPHRTQLRTISMIFTFDNKFDQTDEVDYMFIFKIKHQYSF